MIPIARTISYRKKPTSTYEKKNHTNDFPNDTKL